MAEKILDVLIVGAGPVGLFCANEVSRHGLNCRIIDKKRDLSDKSKALAIHIRSLDLMEDCGFIDEILIQGQRINGALFRSEGEQLADLTFEEVEASRHYFIDLPQDKTERILHQGLLNKGLAVEWQTELTGIEQRADGATALLTHSDGHQEEVQSSWIIACDGSHSTLRELVKAQFIGDVYPQTWWLADLLIEWGFPNDKIVLFASQRGPMACFPIGEKRYRLVMAAEEKISHKEPTLDDIERVFKARTREKATLSDPLWISQFGIAHRQIDKYRYNRIFFAGDAAHVHSPMGGQGLNTGMQDIYNLVWKLALVQNGMAKDEILESYHLERHPIGEQVLKKTGLITQLMLFRNPFLIYLRNKFAEFITSFKAIRHYVTKDLAELSISYAKSPIVKKLGQSTRFKIGEFPPPFSLTNLHTKEIMALQDITRGTFHHLFLFASKNNTNTTDLLKTANLMNERFHNLMKTHLIMPKENDIVGSNSIFFDSDQSVYQHFKINEGIALLIRPDKYIGLTQSPINEEELIHYIEEIYISK